MNEKKPDYLIIPVEILETIGSYLVQRPYMEVVDMLDAIKKLQPYRPDEEQKDTTTP